MTEVQLVFKKEQGIVWFVGLVANSLAILVVLGGTRIGYREGIGNFVWWWADNFIPYMMTTLAWCLLMMSFLIYISGKVKTPFGSIIGLITFFTASFWYSGYHFTLYAENSTIFAMGLVLWCGGTLLLGVVMVLTGIFYALHAGTHSRLLGLVVVAFIVAGFFGIAIGYFAGFSELPFITYFEIPLVSIVLTIPCGLALLYHAVLK